MKNGKPLLVLLGVGAAAALAGKALAGKGSSGALPSKLITFKGELVDTTPQDVRTGTRSALREWAKSRGFTSLTERGGAMKLMNDELAPVVRALIMNAEDARKLHAAAALFATLKGFPLLGVLVFEPLGGVFSEVWVLPP